MAENRRRFGIALLAALLCLAAIPAHALPQYDTDTYCHRMAGLSGGAHGKTLFNNCQSSEQRQRDQAAHAWDKSAPETQRRCDILARSAGTGRYARLRSCLEKAEAHHAVQRGAKR